MGSEPEVYSPSRPGINMANLETSSNSAADEVADLLNVGDKIVWVGTITALVCDADWRVPVQIF